MGEELAVAGTLEGFPSDRFNVLAPVLTVLGAEARSPYLAESVSIVKISPEEDLGETYTEFRYANARDGKRALTSLGLQKIAAAAGIRFLPTEVISRERRRDGHVYIHVRAAGAVRMPNGEWAVDSAEKEIDTEDWLELARDAKLRANERRGERKTEATMESELRRDLLAFREHLLSHAETRARSRLIRRILSLKQVYHVDDLKRPFAVPRLVFAPELAGAEEIQRLQIIGEASLGGSSAVEAMYGGRRRDPVPPLAREMEPELELESGAAGDGEAPANTAPALDAGEAESGEPAPAKPKARSRRKPKDEPATSKADDSTDAAAPADGSTLPDGPLPSGPMQGRLLSSLSAKELEEVAGDAAFGNVTRARARARLAGGAS